MTVLTAVVLAALGVGYTVYAPRLETSKFHLLPLHQPYTTLDKSYAEDFGQLEDIVVVGQSPTVEISAAYAARLAGGGPRLAHSTVLRVGRLARRAPPRRVESGLLLVIGSAMTLTASLVVLPTPVRLGSVFGFRPKIRRPRPPR